MSENYPSDVKLNDNPDGTVSFATEVVATIAGLAATEVDGVASMVSPSSGFADMFSRKNTRNFTKGVRIDLDESRVTVDISIVVDYGSPVPDVARSIQENVKKAVETMSGLEVRSVDVHVTGISFEREQRANAELDEQHRKMLERNEEKAAEAETAPDEDSVDETPAEDDLDDVILDDEDLDDDEMSSSDDVVEVKPVLSDPEEAAVDAYEDEPDEPSEEDEPEDDADEEFECAEAPDYSDAEDDAEESVTALSDDDDLPEVIKDV